MPFLKALMVKAEKLLKVREIKRVRLKESLKEKGKKRKNLKLYNISKEMS